MAPILLPKAGADLPLHPGPASEACSKSRACWNDPNARWTLVIFEAVAAIRRAFVVSVAVVDVFERRIVQVMDDAVEFKFKPLQKHLERPLRRPIGLVR